MQHLIKQWFEHELAPILANKAALFAIFGGVLGYAILYPQPYLNQQAYNVPVAVIDHNTSQLSRTFIRAIDASPNTQVTTHLTSIHEARPLIEQEAIAGVIYIPRDFTRELVAIEQPSIVVAANAAYFLEFSAVAKGALAGIEGTLPTDESNLSEIALFDTHGGYLNYVVPAVFILILHQTLVLGVSLIAFSQKQNGFNLSPLVTLVFRLASMLVIYLPLSAFYFYACFWFYDIHHFASLGSLLLATSLFLLATILFGSLLGYCVAKAEHAVLWVLFSSIPLVFSAGFIWPEHLVPDLIVNLLNLVPALSSIDALLKINQMGASIADVSQQLLWLGGLTALYFIACLIRISTDEPSTSSMKGEYR